MTDPKLHKQRLWLYGLCAIIGYTTGYYALGPVIDTAVAHNLQRGGVSNGPWSTRLDLARPDTPTHIRAAVARIGLGANQAEEAMYWNAYRDNAGQPLQGHRTYQVILPPQIPVDGFWSLTVYGPDHFLIPNSHNRYAITDRQIPATDTTVTVWLGPHAPDGVSTDSPYWIPTTGRDDNLILLFRAYQPHPIMLNRASTVPLPRIVALP